MAKISDIENIRHSLAHLLAAAVMQIWPGAKRTIGPAIDNGFYFDFQFSKPISEADLPKIEKKMREILPTWDKFTRHDLSAKDAKKEYPSNPFKHELIEEFSQGGKEKVSFYKSGNYWDLCRGGHAESMKEIKPDSFKLTHLAGAYWRGSEKNPMLTRIYGIAFASKQGLDEYLKMLEEAKRRDHKKLGIELGLFMFHETAPGMPYWLPKGVKFYNGLVDFWRNEHAKRGYLEIVSPILNKKELYVTSGHFEHYWDSMFTMKTSEGEEYGVKAMNCPNAMVVFGAGLRSYKDLPLRLSDTDPLHRNELSGTLNGLFRVRSFRQDDAHIFITEDGIAEEYKNIFAIVERFYSIFGLSYSFRLGTRPDKFLGDKKTWDKAEKALKKILKDSKKEFTVAEKDGAFYGPKIDILMKDALGRQWQMGTIQLDFQQPKRFGLEYIDEKARKQTPVVIHRVIYGSLERFIGILIEHFAGAFPVWLAPTQVAVLPISDQINEYAKAVAKDIGTFNIRAEIDGRNESIGKKIREAEMQKIPYMLIVGQKEQAQKTVAVRARSQKDLGPMSLEKFIELATKQIETKSL